MVRLHHLRSVSFGLCALGFVACASGPEKPDLIATMLTEEHEPNTSADVSKSDDQKSDDQKSDAEERAKGTIPFGKEGMNRPTFVAGPTPSLPPEALANHVMGVWVARCIMTEDGSVEGCKLIKGLPFSNAHLFRIIHAQKYTPVIFQGKPQRVFYTFKITFK